MQALQQLFSYQFLFQIDPFALHRADYVFLWIGLAALALALLGTVARWLTANPVTKALWRRLSVSLLYVGLAEVIWYGLRYERVRFFGTHLVAMLLALGGVVWLLIILAYALRRYRADRTAWDKQQLKRKYLEA